MGKKKGAKKGGGDDDFWEEAGETVPAATGGADSGDDAPAPRKSAFAAMSIEDPNEGDTSVPGKTDSAAHAGGDDNDGDDDAYGGLMGAIKKNTGKDKKGKKNKKQQQQQQDDDIWDELGEDVSGNAAKDATEDADAMDVDGASPPAAAAKNALPATAEDNEDPAPPAAADDGEGSDAAGENHGGSRILSKKEKERLKKEKEKAKKKAQAAAKKAATGGGADEAPPAPTKAADEEAPEAPEGTASAANDEDEDDDGPDASGLSAADKKKKKKKKKAADTKAEPAAAPAGKKPSAVIQALQAQQAAKRKAEEEARLAEEEARRREEEAERLEKEEEERKEAERQRRKERERLKREQLKKEGKLLTPKQKAEKAAAEARMQQMIASGSVKIDGLAKRDKTADDDESKEQRRRRDNDRKKKKGPSGPPSKLAPATDIPVPVEEDESAVHVSVPDADAIEASNAKEEESTESVPLVQDEPADDGDVKDSWDAASEQDVKDSWDAESEDEDTKKAKAEEKTAASAAKASVKPQANGKAAVSQPGQAKVNAVKQSAAAATPAPVKGKGRQAQEAESSSEEDSDNSDEDSDDESEDDDGLTVAQRMAAQRKAEADKRRQEKHEAALRETSKDDLRSPICCIMGHVDTGKTKLLDKIRQTNVQEGEAGGITQQIGATYFPVDTLRQKIAPIDPEAKQEFKVPGLLVIDTPGHESFTNLRTRGSSLCNIAILVVDIMHGLEPQTLESIRLLRDRKTPFIVALNKIDRLYGWKATPDGAFRESLKKQDRATQNEFEDRLQKTMVLFAEQGLNAVPYYDNKNFAKNVSLVPTSAHTGEGIPDMLQLLVNLTQDRMQGKLMYLSELECTVLEVKVIEGLGTTIDVILSNGVMREGDKIVLCGLNGPIVTQVRALLTPQPLKEMRVKGSYVHHKMVKAALGVKISAPDLDKAISGSRLLVCGEDDDEEDLKEEVMSDLTSLLHSIDKSGRGVCVQASTLGSLEALLEFLKQMKIPVNGINIGPVYKRDVMRCSTMLEKAPDLAVMLCFDVDLDKDAEKLAEDLGVKIFSARIIYHLFDAFVAHQKAVLDRKQKASADTAVWPCRLKILAVFAKRSPIILGCEIAAGDLRLGTPLCVKHKDSGEIVNLGRVTSLEVNHKRLDTVTAKSAGAGVAVRIECAPHETARTYGRHFTDQDEVMSHISRQSIDTLKELFWDQVSIEQKKTIKYLKAVQGVA